LGLDASPFAGTAGGPPNTGQFFIALSPDSFSGSLYKQRLSRLVGAIGDQPGSRIPGSRRWNHRKDHEANGVEVDPKIITTVQNLAEGSN
jgi:(2R)-3-sulfolactate dehydrogenase (NADP+)